MNLKETDLKLLSYLYHNNREPLSKIARACKLTREQVNYKIKKYQEQGIIKGFFTLFDWSKFGYEYLVILLLKFEKPSSIKPFIHELKNSKNCLSFGKIYGKYDLYINAIFKNEKELGDYIAEIDTETNLLSDYLVLKPYLTELYPVKFFNHKNKEIISYDYKNMKARKFDSKEMQILKILAKNTRARIIDIANKINLSAELTFYKIKKLQKDKVIIGSRIQFDMEKLRYFFSLLMLNIKNFSKSKQEKIKHYASTSKHINSLTFNLGKPNCTIQLFHKEESELRKTIDEIKDLLKEESFDIEVILIGDDEGEVNPLPFVP